MIEVRAALNLLLRLLRTQGVVAVPGADEIARKAVEEKIAGPLDLSVKDAALGILRIINSNMALAIRSNSVARGIDPREFSIMPFGGAGPLQQRS